MKTAIMQPYFLPYIGYWQLINAVDTFVIYDNIQYTKKGWFNRNRFLQNGQDVLFSIPLKKDNNYLNVDKRFISPEFNKKELIAQFQNAYAKAPYLKEGMSILDEIINYNEDNLFKYLYNSVQKICGFLDIDTKIIISSTINIDHNLKSKDKVITICKDLGANSYINPIGGYELYNKTDFEKNGLSLMFIKTNPIAYNQLGEGFLTNLSIIDMIMFNDKKTIIKYLNEYVLT